MNTSLNTVIGYDTTFELNEFREPKIKSEIEVVKDIILFILFSKEGQYPSLPKIGLNIRSYLYSFYDDLNVMELKSELIHQCEALGCYFDMNMINIRKKRYNNQPSLLINVYGTEKYPNGYMKDHIRNNGYLIGITYDELKRMIYDVKEL